MMKMCCQERLVQVTPPYTGPPLPFPLGTFFPPLPLPASSSSILILLSLLLHFFLSSPPDSWLIYPVLWSVTRPWTRSHSTRQETSARYTHTHTHTHTHMHTHTYTQTHKHTNTYRIAGNIGGELNLADWWFG